MALNIDYGEDGQVVIRSHNIQDILTTMVERNVDVNAMIRCDRSSSPHTMIVHAVQCADEESVRLLLERKADPEWETSPKWSILDYAIGKWGDSFDKYEAHIQQRDTRCRIVSMLLPHLRNPEYGSPLRCAIQNVHADMFDLLRRAGCKQWQPSLDLGRPRLIKTQNRGVPKPEDSRWEVLLHSKTYGYHMERDKRRIFMGLLAMQSMMEQVPHLSSPPWDEECTKQVTRVERGCGARKRLILSCCCPRLPVPVGTMILRFLPFLLMISTV
jgi:hypothetical protein